jgi:hypothetical protein
MHKRVLTCRKALAWLMALCLFLPGVAAVWAETETELQVVEGSFDGVNQEKNRLWISDKVFILDPAVRVKGGPNKLSLLSDLKQGERIKATLSSNEQKPSMPYVILIERE